MGHLDYKDWSEGWLREGFYISYLRDNTRYFEQIMQRDWAHWEYDWPEVIGIDSTSGPFTPSDLEITRGYDAATNTNQIWQLIFGIKGEVFIYVELPTDLHRHGIPKVPKPTTTMRRVSHYTELISPFNEPSFLTEHFMMRPETLQISFDAYNPCNIAQTDVILNILINKMVTLRMGTVQNGTETPTSPIWADVLDKLYKRQIPHRPITMQPVRAPAEAPAGE
jgi:hypothetical protein